ncbi:MAG TPA: zinc finger domain-containing protein, partial [Caldimonas sp.]
VSIFTETYSQTAAWPGAKLLAKWARIREIRDLANKEIEAVRSVGGLGSSLQANLAIGADADDLALLASLGDDLKFVTITSRATLAPATSLAIAVTPASAPKCERCWHWRDDVGSDPARPDLCGRCTDAADLCGGKSRRVA